MALQGAEGVRVGELCSRQELLVRTDECLSARRVSGAASPPRCLDGVCTKRSGGPKATRGVGCVSKAVGGT